MAFAGIFWRTRYVRPQLFSVLLFAVLLVVIERVDEGRGRPLLIVPPLMALWANLHGGWIVGLATFGCWAAVRAFDRRAAARDRVAVVLASAVGLAATLVNPYGVQMWTFLAETVRFGRANIDDWGTILSHPLALGIPWAIVLSAGAIAAWKGKIRRVDLIAIVCGLAIASFRVSRLDAFFTLAVVVFLAPRAIRAALSAQAETASQPLPRGVLLITAATVVAMLIPAASVAGPYASCVSVGGPWAPDAKPRGSSPPIDCRDACDLVRLGRCTPSGISARR